MTTATSRLLLVLSLLQLGRDWPGQALAERVAVSPRTLRRDIDHLREMGYRIRAIKGPHGGYRLEAGSELPPLLFDDEQAVALAVALQTATASGAGIGEAAARALTTVRQVLPARLRHRLDQLEVTALSSAERGASTEVEPAVLLALSGAVRARHVLRFDYTTDAARQRSRAAPALPPRRVEAHHVVTRDGRWYLVGWDLDRGDWRVFRADRITPRTPTGPRFAPRELPGNDIGTFLSARFKGSDGADVWPCIGEVVLDLSAREVAPFAADGIVEAIAPGRCRLVAGSWSWTALAAAFGRFDADIEVIGPTELAEAFARLARRYGHAASGSGGARCGAAPPR
ncbi:transcriptional regulator [Agromyces badenianii]|uniref:Transcriptional regulator n=1 Tax=Agromyces badenianii TaxID=2080742 RepID=A0A2S0WYZ3_9MICO|nr:WYL domain-containing protein [Agromyces badenianii]AWB96414.1 transcriptional regulator [Agromyces badenianii]